MVGEYTTELNLYKPTVGENVSLQDHFNDNWDELEARLGNLNGISEAQCDYLKALTTHPLGGDGTAGRIPRILSLLIQDGTNADTIKCTVLDVWNGDTIAVTDNIAKNATVGNFWLDAAGYNLKILASGLTGNVVGALGSLQRNALAIDILFMVYHTGGNISMECRDATAGTAQDLTDLAGAELIYVNILYFTDE